MNTKIGYSLLFGGIILIIFSAVSMTLVLTRKTQPIHFYSPEDVNFDFSSMIPDYGDITKLGGVVKPEATDNNFMSSDALVDSFNLLIHMFLMGFLINVGSKIAMLGSSLVRPIVVKVNKTEQVISPKASKEVDS